MLAAVQISDVMLAIGLLIAAVVVLAAVLLVYRSRVLAHDNTSEAQRGLLDDLRAMRDRGELTIEEFEAAKRSVAARLRGEAGAPTPARTPAAPARAADASGAIVAPPGYDLTGRPLPGPGPRDRKPA